MMLTGREIQVARCISRGMYEKEIADRLHISMATIHAHARNIRQKIGAGNIADITRKYIVAYDLGAIIHQPFHKGFSRGYLRGRSKIALA